MAARTLPSVTLVEDSAHRDALWEAVRSTSRQVVVAGDIIAPTVVRQPFVAALTERAESGVRVDLLYRYVRSQAADPRELLAKASTSAPRFKVHQGQSAARALIWDDELIVGSFDFLSHDGSYRGSRAADRRLNSAYGSAAGSAPRGQPRCSRSRPFTARP